MEKIGAWIRDPSNNIFKGQTKKAGLYELFCLKPDTCDLLKMENSCLHCGAVSPCKFGRKIGTEGPTRQARSYYTTVQKWRERNEGFLNKLASLKAYNRVFKTHGHFYLPYSWMSVGIFGGDKAPLQSKWVAEEDMTADLLHRLCTHIPYALFGGPIADYQKKEVPKFIADLHLYYPEIFARLPDEQKSRLSSVSYVGRKADITTCAPGKYLFSKSTWTWDGEVLRGGSMLFQPVAGDLAITIKPKPGQPVEITSNEQVLPTTRFLD